MKKTTYPLALVKSQTMPIRALRKKLQRFPIAKQLKQAFANHRGKAGGRTELVNGELWGKSRAFRFQSVQKY